MGVFVMRSISKLIVLAAVVIGTVMPASAHAAIFDCSPVEVGEFAGSRIHVECANPNSGGIRFIAINSTSSAAQRFVSMATSALLAGKIFRVDIPSTSTTNVSGCGASDCRTPTFFGVRN
jgi:hypothetical protein